VSRLTQINIVTLKLK